MEIAQIGTEDCFLPFIRKGETDDT
ncbi:hypothetical protein CGSSp19BS75_07572 [Streptococcus pneumoniae SP19-BS75]|nr:hypothetical protein CGSSp19BS75_07572 [Streptococcus pneumoniae SP19-BS75]